MNYLKKVQKFHHPPDRSIITKDLEGEIDYIDSFKINWQNSSNYSVDYLTAALFSFFPGWVWALLKLRDFIVKPFGIQTGLDSEPPILNRSLRYNVGQKAVAFTVINRSESEIVMAEDDKHLYFRISVFSVSGTEKDPNEIFLTTIVQFHNALGKLYFIPVKPFHQLIIRSLLKHFLKTH